MADFYDFWIKVNAFIFWPLTILHWFSCNIPVADLLSPSVILVSIGLIVLLIALFGLCGAIAQNTCMMFTVSTSKAVNLNQKTNDCWFFLSPVFTFLGSSSNIANWCWSLCFVQSRQSRRNIGQSFQRNNEELWKSLGFCANSGEKISSFEINNRSIQTKTILNIQFECCGVNGPDDWKNVDNGLEELPHSCCKNTGSTCKPEDAITLGCKKALFDFMKPYYFILAAIVIFIFVVQVCQMWIS